MLRYLIALTLVAWGTVHSHAGGTVQLSLHCLSLQFSAATANDPSGQYTLNLDQGQDGSAPPTGELALQGVTSAYSHGGFLRLDPPDMTGPYFLPFGLNVPPLQDQNQNSLSDFFEVSQGVASVTTSGQYADPAFGGGPINATWSRAAGTNVGACTLALPNLGLTFHHQFQLIEFEGPLTYTNAQSGANLTGLVRLQQSLNPANVLTGLVSFTVLSKDQVQLNAGSWTNANGEIFSYQAARPLQRGGTNYLALFQVSDGEPLTTVTGYTNWAILIADAADANGNGVPDFSDPVAVTPPTPPLLAIQVTTNALALVIQGQAGRVYDLQNITSLGQTNWTVQTSVTMTNATQTLVVARPSSQTAFWRLKVH